MTIAPANKVRPSVLARRWGLKVDTIYTWIRTGELRAINVAKKVEGRPRYLLDEDDIAAFAQRRAIAPPSKPRRPLSRHHQVKRYV